jgi:hypothetical protein
LSPTDEGVAGVLAAEGFGLSAAEPPLFSGGDEGHSGLVTPAAASDSRSADAGGGVEPETGEAIGRVSEVAAGLGDGDGEGFGASFEEAGDPEDESLPFRSAPLRSVPLPLGSAPLPLGSVPLAFGSAPFLPSESDFGSGFFRTTVSG